MFKYYFSMYRHLVVGDLEHAWYFDCGSGSTPPYLLAANFTIPWLYMADWAWFNVV